VRTWCDDAAARRAGRERENRLLARRPVLDALGYRTVEERVAVATQMRTTFDFPVLAVGTNDGYDPPLDRIVEFVVNPRG
jgi:hypothetical protein